MASTTDAPRPPAEGRESRAGDVPERRPHASGSKKSSLLRRTHSFSKTLICVGSRRAGGGAALGGGVALGAVDTRSH
ncbi:hypothetical protein EYF80_044092 [Liparis tanakae]|uniref:Uncharacterized protein n=1 Tax=Liparis tanakae TaxID=230148 RepID=A0A4Z2FXI8_9TELE|nr:hypothetical protein EYF80_044092 [Liparis tanakae]